MKTETTAKGVQQVLFPYYASAAIGVLLAQSSANGCNLDLVARRNAEFLWVGEHHLSRSQVRELVLFLTHWLESGLLYNPPPTTTIAPGPAKPLSDDTDEYEPLVEPAPEDHEKKP